MSDPEPFYRLDAAGALVPGPLAIGPPWLPGTQHGSMVSALMARAVEQAPSAAPMRLTRLTVDLSRSVPLGPTHVTTTIVRDGRRVQVVDIELWVNGEPCSRGNAIRIRVDGDTIAEADRPRVWPEDVMRSQPDAASVPSPLGPDPLWDAHGMRWEHHEPGRGVVWLRPVVPLVGGEPLSPLVRVAMIADLVMTGGGIVPMDRYTVINPDLTLHLLRPPRSEWMQITSTVRINDDGTGHSEGEIFDESGWIGRALKSLLVDRRRG